MKRSEQISQQQTARNYRLLKPSTPPHPAEHRLLHTPTQHSVLQNIYMIYDRMDLPFSIYSRLSIAACLLCSLIHTRAQNLSAQICSYYTSTAAAAAAAAEAPSSVFSCAPSEIPKPLMQSSCTKTNIRLSLLNDHHCRQRTEFFK